MAVDADIAPLLSRRQTVIVKKTARALGKDPYRITIVTEDTRSKMHKFARPAKRTVHDIGDKADE